MRNPNRVQDRPRARAPDTEDGRKAGRGVLLRRNVDACDTSHRSPSTLALLMARVRTDHAHHALAPDHLAVAAHLLHRSHHLHHSLPSETHFALNTIRARERS